MSDLVIASGSSGVMVNNPLWMAATVGDPDIDYDAQDDRALLDALVVEGVFGAADFKVSQRAAGANLTVDIAAGFAAVLGDTLSRQGKYLAQSVGTVNTGTAGNITVPGSGTRVHRVILRIRDKAATGSDYDYTLEILEDTGSGLPALPASAISLAKITVPSGSASVTNAMIADDRPFANSPRGLIGGQSYGGSTTNLASGIGTSEAYLGMISGFVDVRAGYEYEVRAMVACSVSANGASPSFNLRVDDGGTHLTGNVIGYFIPPPLNTSTGYVFNFSRRWSPVSSARIQVALTGSRYSGYGSGTISVTRRNELSVPTLEVVEIGPSSLVVAA